MFLSIILGFKICKKFFVIIYRSFYTLWKFVFLIGNSELSSKMVSYTTDLKIFVIKAFGSSYGSYSAVERQ
jgi:hypothetical protein